jgi:hypothetical protein
MDFCYQTLQVSTATMIYTITRNDIWDEFVYYRQHGRDRTAFMHIRNRLPQSHLESMIASIANHKYKPRIGDIIMMEGSKLGIVWSPFYQEMFKNVPKTESLVSSNNRVTA